MPTNYIKLEDDDESRMALLRAWHAFADDCGMASEYLPLVAFLPEDLRGDPIDFNNLTSNRMRDYRGDPIDFNNLIEFSQRTDNRLIGQIDWI